MALTENLPLVESAPNSKVENSEITNNNSEELKIITSDKSFVEESPMSENLKEAIGKNAPNMTNLFQSILSQKKENVGDIKIDGDTIYADEVSPMTLHLFALEAAKFGKTITYKEVKSIIISG